MKNTAKFLTQLSLLALGTGLVHCRKEPEPSRASQPKTAVPPGSAAGAPLAAPSPVASERVPAPVASLEATPEADLGDWIEAFPYKFKVTGIKRCGGGAAGAADKSYRLGIRVQVFSKYDELLVASRDVTLESGGIILQSDLDPKPSPGCSPLLEAKQLRNSQTLGGVVTFTIPEEFDARKAVVVYRATRWGGAPRVEFKIPDCFDACDGKRPRGAARK